MRRSRSVRSVVCRALRSSEESPVWKNSVLPVGANEGENDVPPVRAIARSVASRPVAAEPSTRSIALESHAPSSDEGGGAGDESPNPDIAGEEDMSAIP